MMKALNCLLLTLIFFVAYGNNGALSVSDETKKRGVTFKVDDVQLPDSLLKTHTILQITENKINKKTTFFPSEHSGLKLVYAPNHGFIYTLQSCYAEHRPLILSPDAVWLVICQGVSMHINQNFESFENKIFVKNKPKEIVIRNDSLEYGEKHWKQLVTSFADETKKYTKDDVYSFFLADYSTTTHIEKTAYQITLLEAYKKAFAYVGETGCGIPSITLTGTRSDWVNLYNRLDKLNTFELDYWADELRPLIQEFINAFDGNINQTFWQSIYKEASEYNGYYLSGWFIKFFPYVKYRGSIPEDAQYDEEFGGFRVDETYVVNPYLKGNDYLLSVLSTDNFPSGLSQIEITWNNYFKNETKKMDVYSGFFAVKQYPDKSLEPFISWVISDKSDSSFEEIESEYRESLFPNKYWIPHVADSTLSLVKPAVYDVRSFKDQKESLDYIKKYLEEKINSDSRFNNLEKVNIKLNFIVLSNGEVTKLEVDGNKLLTSFLEKQLKELPAAWMPALAHPFRIMEMMDFREDMQDLKVKVNSKIEIILFEK